MKAVSKLMLLTLIVAIFTIISCKKDATPEPVTNTPTTPPPPAGLSSLNSLFEHKGAQSQNFTIDNINTQIITGAQGTKITFNPNSFVTFAGAEVTGNINIELKEIYDKKTMLLSDITTNGLLNGQQEPLVSGGEFYVNATQNGIQLKLRQGQKFSAFLPSISVPDPGMNYFNGSIKPEGIVWALNKDTVVLPTSTSPKGYFVNCDSLRWGNADRFLPNPNYTSVTLNIAGNYDPSEIKAYVWYDNVKTVWSFWKHFNTATNVFSDNHTASGLPAHFIVVSFKDGKLYTAVLGTTITTNATYNLTLSETTEDAFANSLAALP